MMSPPPEPHFKSFVPVLLPLNSCPCFSDGHGSDADGQDFVALPLVIACYSCGYPGEMTRLPLKSAKIREKGIPGWK
ncbi:MAG: hypothetical protein WCK53_06930 [Methanomicrobiales archaeon]